MGKASGPWCLCVSVWGEWGEREKREHTQDRPRDLEEGGGRGEGGGGLAWRMAPAGGGVTICITDCCCSWGLWWGKGGQHKGSFLSPPLPSPLPLPGP